MKNILKKIIVGILASSVIVTSLGFTVSAAEKKDTTYNKVEEIFDWGAATTKVIVDLKQEVKQGSVDNNTFTVFVSRRDERIKEKPLLSEGNRVVKEAYISDASGNKTDKGNYATLVMEVGPKIDLGSPLNYFGGSNVWITTNYTITQKKDIKTETSTITGLEAKTLDKRSVALVDKFKLDKATYKDSKFGDITMSYAHFTPTSTSSAKKPLIIWLHGGGEGGTDATIPLSANKACNLASDKVQAYFGGAYVLAPQSPTKWMDDGSGGSSSSSTKNNADSMYTGALKNLIDEYVKNNPAIDPNRIYVGGCSNGGFMTMRLIMDYPNYFAAAYPVCEATNDKFITDEDIENIKDIPMWFVCAATDGTVSAPQYTLSTYDRLIKAGAPNTHLTYFKNVVDTSGLYKDANGQPHEYDGHWSWIYAYNNEVTGKVNGKDTTLMQWISAQKNTK